MAGPLDRAFVEIIPDFSDFNRATRRGVEQASRDIERGLSRGLERAESQAARDGARIGQVTGSNFSEGLAATLSSIAGIRLPTGGFVVLGGAMAAAAAAAVQLAAALAPAVGIIAALPSSVGVLAAGMSTLNVATLGVGDAFEAAATGSAEEFQGAIEGMAPAVQEAAQAIRDMMPALEELRNSVQDAFFQDFDTVLNTLAETLLGPVTAGMVAVAEQINSLITGLTVVATSAEGVNFVTQSFQIMADIIAQLQEPLILLFSSLLNVGTALNEAFGATAGQGLANLITQFALFLEQAASSGQAVAWVNDALAVFQQIGEILSPIVGIFGAIGEAAARTGGNILGVFGSVLQTFDDFLNSVQGQTVLVSLFQALNTVGAAFATVLGNIAPALPPIIDGIASILGVVAPLLGPLSELVGSVLSALAPILGVVAAAIQPIIGPLTQIITLLGNILVSALDAVMPLIEILAELLGSGLSVVLEIVAAALEVIAPILGILFEALAPIIEALTPLIELFAVVADIIGAVLSPIINALGAILLWLVETVIVPVLMPIIQALGDILSGFLGDAIASLVEKFRLAGIGLEIIFNFIKDAFESNVETMAAVMEFLTNAFQVGWNTINNSVFQPIKSGIGVVRQTISTALSGIQTGWNNLVGFLKGLPGRVRSATSGMWDGIAGAFRSAINSIISAWNRLSFTLPSVDAGPLGTFGGFTLSTPNIPSLATSGFSFGEGLVNLHPNEAIVNAKDSRGLNMLATALGRASEMNDQRTGVQTDTSIQSQLTGANFRVFIGDRELRDIVIEEQNESQRNTLRRARAATGRMR